MLPYHGQQKVDLLIHCTRKVKASYKEGQSLDVDELMDHVSVEFDFYHPIPNTLQITTFMYVIFYP